MNLLVLPRAWAKVFCSHSAQMKIHKKQLCSVQILHYPESAADV